MSTTKNLAFNRVLSNLSFAFLAVLWAITIYAITHLPERIPIHFNIHDEADGWGSKTTLWLMPIIGTFIVALLNLVKRYPKYLNYPVEITEENRERQQQLAFGLLSGIACVVALLFCYIIYSTMKYVEDGSFAFPILLVLAGVFIPIVIYFYLALRKR